MLQIDVLILKVYIVYIRLINSIVCGCWNAVRNIVCLVWRNLITVIKYQVTLIFLSYLFILLNILALLFSFIIVWSFRDNCSRLNYVLLLNSFLIIIVLKRSSHTVFILICIIMI